MIRLCSIKSMVELIRTKNPVATVEFDFVSGTTLLFTFFVLQKSFRRPRYYFSPSKRYLLVLLKMN